MSYNEAYQNLWTGGVTISPHSWYHQCTRLNTITGQQSGATLIGPDLSRYCALFCYALKGSVYRRWRKPNDPTHNRFLLCIPTSHFIFEYSTQATLCNFIVVEYFVGRISHDFYLYIRSPHCCGQW